jgi:hypothetical protein
MTVALCCPHGETCEPGSPSRLRAGFYFRSSKGKWIQQAKNVLHGTGCSSAHSTAKKWPKNFAQHCAPGNTVAVPYRRNRLRGRGILLRHRIAMEVLSPEPGL